MPVIPMLQQQVSAFEEVLCMRMRSRVYIGQGMNASMGDAHNLGTLGNLT